MKTTIIPITDARKNIFSLVEETKKTGAVYSLTRNGREAAVLVSAETFRRITHRGGALRIADGDGRRYGAHTPEFHFRSLIIRDESRVVYLSGNDQKALRQEEDLIKAQLFVMLVEKYGYPLRRVEVGRYIKVGAAESRHYIEADIIVNDDHGNARIICEVGAFRQYEENTDRVVGDLYALAGALDFTKKPERLLYYSRAIRDGAPREKITAIDCAQYPTFLAWKRAGRPAENVIPKCT